MEKGIWRGCGRRGERRGRVRYHSATVIEEMDRQRGWDRAG